MIDWQAAGPRSRNGCRCTNLGRRRCAVHDNDSLGAVEIWRRSTGCSKVRYRRSFGSTLVLARSDQLIAFDHAHSWRDWTGNNSRVRGLSKRARGYRNPNNLMLVPYHASWRTPTRHHPNAR